MAEATSQLNILVKLRDEASGALRRLSGEISEIGGSAKFSNIQIAGFAGALSAFSGITIKSAINAFSESEQKMAVFRGILKTLTPELQQQESTILALADSYLSFGIGTEDAAIGIARALAVTKDITQAQRLFEAAIGLSLETQRDFRTSLEEVLRIAEEGIKGFDRYGIGIREVDDSLGRLEKIHRRFAPVLQEQAGTLQTTIKIFGELKTKILEALGQVYAPHITLVKDKILEWIQAQGGINAFLERNNHLIKIVAFSLATIFVSGAIAAFIAVNSLIGGFILLTAKITLLIGTSILAATLIVNAFKGVQRDLIFIFDTIVGKIDELINFLERLIQTARRALSIAGRFIGGAVGAVGGFIQNILPFQHGGIVTRPTLGLLGEAGAEAVIPLSRFGGAGIGGITINLQGDFFTTEEVAEKFGNEIARIVKNQIKL